MASPLGAVKNWWALPAAQRWHWASIKLRLALGLPARMNSPDRDVLEGKLFPYYAARPEIKRVLFIGCDWYTAHYSRLFGPQRDYWTMDYDPKQARYGNGTKHIQSAIQDVALHFEPSSFDLIMCNGVFGYGLNDRVEAVKAFSGCRSLLKPGGEFLLGWNDVPPHAPFDPSQAALAAGFEKAELPPLGQWRTVLDMPTRHVFEGYRRPA